MWRRGQMPGEPRCSRAFTSQLVTRHALAAVNHCVVTSSLSTAPLPTPQSGFNVSTVAPSTGWVSRRTSCCCDSECFVCLVVMSVRLFARIACSGARTAKVSSSDSTVSPPPSASVSTQQTADLRSGCLSLLSPGAPSALPPSPPALLDSLPLPVRLPALSRAPRLLLRSAARRRLLPLPPPPPLCTP